MPRLICTELEDTSNIYGHKDCAVWTEEALPTPLIPELTKAEADQITLSIIGVMVLAWGWRQLKTMIR